jgi:sorting nexin-1/2
MSKLGDAMSNATSSFTGGKTPEIDPWFETKRAYIEQLELQLKAVAKSIDNVIKYRDELAAGSEELGESCLTLATSELSKSVEANLIKFGEAQKKAKQVYADQACQDLVHLANTFEEYIRLIGSVKLAFNTRQKIHQLHLKAVADLSKFKISLEKLKLTFRAKPDKITTLEQDILEAESKIVQTKKEFEDVSKVIKDEMEYFELQKVKDIQRSIQSWLKSIADSSEKLVLVWQDYGKHAN